MLIPNDYVDLVEAPNTGVLTTLLKDGSPHSSPVWFAFDGDNVLISTTSDRLKHRNVLHDPRISFVVVDPLQPLRYLEIRGIADIVSDPNCELRDRIAHKHGFVDGSGFDPPGAHRITFRIVPTRIFAH